MEWLFYGDNINDLVFSKIRCGSVYLIVNELRYPLLQMIDRGKCLDGIRRLAERRKLSGWLKLVYE